MRRGWGAIAASVLLVALTSGAAHAQTRRDANEAAGRARLEDDARAGLDAADAQLELADGFFVAGGIAIGVGLAGVLGGSIGTLVCEDAACDPAVATIVAGAALAAVGLGLVIAATLLRDGARDRRRELMLEHLGLAPLPGGGIATLGLRF